jgi:arginase
MEVSGGTSTANDVGAAPRKKETDMEEHPDIRIIAVPYDSGHPDRRMGAGPQHLLDNGLGASLRPGGWGVSITTIRHEREPPAEVATAFELQDMVSRQVRAAVEEDQLPLVLSGNCNTAAVGSLAGAGAEDLGIVWFDAHGEFNTPETTTTGFIDGMGLAIAVGHCWKEMVKGVPGFSPIPEENVVMAWVRAADVAEQERFDASRVTVVGPDTESQGMRAFADTLDDLRSRVGRVYVHLDLDVLDAAEVGMANEYGIRGGIDVGQLEAALDMVRERFTIAAAGIASYDPSFDTDGRVLHAAIAGARTLTRPTSQFG